MKKILLFAFAAFILTSCDNLKKKGATDSDDEEEVVKKKKPIDDEDSEDDEEDTPKKKKKVATDDDDAVIEETPDEEDAERGWTTKERDLFLEECVSTAEKNIGEERANIYCSCFLEKVEKKYASYTQAGKMSDAELKKWAAECNRQ